MSDETQNKFVRMMSVAREHQASDGKPSQDLRDPSTQPMPRVSAKAQRGRPATGKRSDPTYESTTVFLKVETKIAAHRLLLERKQQNLSDVLEGLLAGWVKKNSGS